MSSPDMPHPEVEVDHSQNTGELGDKALQGAEKQFGKEAMDLIARKYHISVLNADKKPGYVRYDLKDGEEKIGEVEITHEPSVTGSTDWARAYTIGFISADGEGLTREAVAKPEDLEKAVDYGMGELMRDREHLKAA